MILWLAFTALLTGHAAVVSAAPGVADLSMQQAAAAVSLQSSKKDGKASMAAAQSHISITQQQPAGRLHGTQQLLVLR
jgi:hypothetical protein